MRNLETNHKNLKKKNQYRKDYNIRVSHKNRQKSLKNLQYTPKTIKISHNNRQKSLKKIKKIKKISDKYPNII